MIRLLYLTPKGSDKIAHAIGAWDDNHPTQYARQHLAWDELLAHSPDFDVKCKLFPFVNEELPDALNLRKQLQGATPCSPAPRPSTASKPRPTSRPTTRAKSARSPRSSRARASTAKPGS